MAEMLQRNILNTVEKEWGLFGGLRHPSWRWKWPSKKYWETSSEAFVSSTNPLWSTIGRLTWFPGWNQKMVSSWWNLSNSKSSFPKALGLGLEIVKYRSMSDGVDATVLRADCPDCKDLLETDFTCLLIDVYNLAYFGKPIRHAFTLTTTNVDSLSGATTFTIAPATLLPYTGHHWTQFCSWCPYVAVHVVCRSRTAKS